MSLILKGRRSLVERINYGEIKKTYRKDYLEDFKRELKALEILEEYKHFPKIIQVGDNYLIMNYVGEEIKDGKGLKNQALAILKSLNEAGIEHRDAWKSHWRELDGVLSLIDFGACYFRGQINLGVRKFKQRITDKEAVSKFFKD